jgi:hypothetical protein
MPIDPQLENYLTRLEKGLAPFPSSERAEIIIDVKSRALNAQEKDPNASIPQILATFGEPEIVANRHVTERGLKPVKPPIAPLFKWLVIGFVSTLALSLAFLVFAFYKFSPLIRVNEGENRLSLFGGTMGLQIGDEEIANFSEGTYPHPPPDLPVVIEMGAANLTLKRSDDGDFTWHCRGRRAQDVRITNPSGVPTLNLIGLVNRCELQVPDGLTLKIKGESGKIKLLKPRYSIDLALNSGTIDIEPDQEQIYRFSLSVEHGKADNFNSSSDPKALPIDIRLQNGKIRHVFSDLEDDNDQYE